MFDKEYFPTPPTLANKMLEPYADKLKKGEFAAILDPSAGTGSLLTSVKSKLDFCYRSQRKANIYAFEINEDAREILQNEATILGHDFLEYYGGTMLFDFIVMNPPFSNGDKHLLHAWDVLARGELVCLLNAETIRNPCTQTRKQVLDLIREHGSVEFVQNGFSSSDSFRKTNVEVAIVRLHKEQFIPELDYDVTDKVNNEEEQLFSTLPALQGFSPALADKLKSTLRCYTESRRAFADYIKALDRLKLFLNPICYSQTELLGNAYGDEGKNNFMRVNDFSLAVRKIAWDIIINEFAPKKFLTKRTEKQLQIFFEKNGYMDLTFHNVQTVIRWIVANSDRLMNESCEEVFDNLTQYTHENRLHVEGWKTNNMWVVANKVIIPYAVDSVWSRPSLNRYSETASDFDRILCWCAGKEYEYKYNAVFGVEIPDCDYGVWYEGYFCDVKIFKKGTMHLRFKDEQVLNEFNRRACSCKNWLGEGKSK